jgi:hypothetical protein
VGESLYVSIAQRLVKLLTVSDRPIEEDGNGLIDKIAADVRLQVVVPGRYLVMVKLMKNDRMEGYASKAVDLKPGDAMITVEFDRATLLRLDGDGPYNLSVEIDDDGGHFSDST